MRLPEQGGGDERGEGEGGEKTKEKQNGDVIERVKETKTDHVCN